MAAMAIPEPAAHPASSVRDASGSGVCAARARDVPDVPGCGVRELRGCGVELDGAGDPNPGILGVGAGAAAAGPDRVGVELGAGLGRAVAGAE